ncbi:MAG TPA: ABC transporter ATP-binding protein [Oligoflexia bacterium]|nr:ABC transporter ATP-binding protein [Oligoflexia bacterium]
MAEILGFRLRLIYALIALILAGAINLLIPYLVSFFLSDLAGWIERPTVMLAIIIGIFAAQAVFFYLRAYNFYELGNAIVSNLRVALIESSLQKSSLFFSKHTSSELATLISSDLAIVQDGIAAKLNLIARYALQVVGGVVMMFVMSSKLTITLLVAIPPIATLFMIFGRKLKAYSFKYQQMISKLAQIATESFNNITVIKAFVRENYVADNFKLKNLKARALGASRYRLSAFTQAFVGFVFNSFLALVVVYGVLKVAQGDVSSADLAGFLLYGGIVGVSLVLAANGAADMAQVFASLERVKAFLDSEKTELEKFTSVSGDFKSDLQQMTGREITTFDGGIEFKNVFFAYSHSFPIDSQKEKLADLASDKLILKNLSFKLSAGEVLALVGRSGIGKSTILGLILGFYRPTSGAILYGDGKSCSREFDVRLRCSISYLPQEPKLFSGTLRDNLKFGDPRANDNQMLAALSRLRLIDFLKNFDGGLDGEVGEGGSKLSLGERQRVAMARALLKDAKLYLFDEPTSALDRANSEILGDIISELKMSGSAVIVVSHSEQFISRVADKVIRIGE